MFKMQLLFSLINYEKFHRKIQSLAKQSSPIAQSDDQPSFYVLSFFFL